MLATVDALKAKGFSVGGMVSREALSRGMRVGFEVLNLNNASKGWLAHVNRRTGPLVGNYHVNIEDLNSIGVEGIADAIENHEVIVIDEIGPMELHSEKFVETARKAIESSKLVIGTVHRNATNALIDETRTRKDAEIHLVTRQNRDTLHQTLISRALSFLSKTQKTKSYSCST